jgi:hypothetical protein
MTDTKSTIIVMLLAWVPYSAVAWGYMVLTDGTAKTFWYALGTLVAARLFFSIIEGLGGILSWRIYGKRVAVQRSLAILRANNFPKRRYAEEDFQNYLAGIEDDPECPESVKKGANEIQLVLSAFERFGILLGMRMHSAAEAAFDLYSPKSEAPAYGESSETKRGPLDSLFE